METVIYPSGPIPNWNAPSVVTYQGQQPQPIAVELRIDGKPFYYCVSIEPDPAKAAFDLARILRDNTFDLEMAILKGITSP